VIPVLACCNSVLPLSFFPLHHDIMFTFSESQFSTLFKVPHPFFLWKIDHETQVVRQVVTSWNEDTLVCGFVRYRCRAAQAFSDRTGNQFPIK